MKRTLGNLLSATFSLLLLLPVAASAEVPGPTYRINKDLKNLGPIAHDVAIVLKGKGFWLDTIDSTTLGTFLRRTEETNAAGNTVIHWDIFDDGGDDQIGDPIRYGQTIHVGIETYVEQTVVDIYFTDENGNRIRNSVVLDVKAGVTYGSSRPTLSYTNENATAVSVKNVRYAVFATPFELGALSRDNDSLANALQSLSEDFVLAPGETMTLEVPASVPTGSAVVTVYEVAAPESDAVVVNYVQVLNKSDS